MFMIGTIGISQLEILITYRVVDRGGYFKYEKSVEKTACKTGIIFEQFSNWIIFTVNEEKC